MAKTLNIALFLICCGLYAAVAVRAELGQGTKTDITNSKQEKETQEADIPLPARILTKAQHFTIVAGEEIVFPCEIENAVNGIVMWMKEKKLLTSGDRKISRSRNLALDISADQRYYNLRLLKAGKDDKGNYSCVVLHADRDFVQIVHTVIIHYPPVVEIQPGGIIQVAEEESLCFTCVVSSNPPSVFKWIFKADNGTTRELPRFTGRHLSMENVSHANAGEYSCVAHNVIGNSVEAPPVRVDIDIRPYRLPHLRYVIGKSLQNVPSDYGSRRSFSSNHYGWENDDLITSAAFDCVDGNAGMIYTANRNKRTIRRAPRLSGWDRRTVVENVTAVAMAVDPVSRRLFWSNGSNIFVANMSNFLAGYTTIVDGPNMDIRAVAVHPFHESLFWTNGDSIETAHVNGSLRWKLFSTVECASIDGNHRRTLPAHLVNPTSIAMYQHTLYITDINVGNRYAIKSIKSGCSVTSFVSPIDTSDMGEKPHDIGADFEFCRTDLSHLPSSLSIHAQFSTAALNLTRARGQSVVLPCKAPYAVSGVVWSKGTEVLTNGTTKVSNRTDIQLTASRSRRFHNLLIRQLRIEDTGQYTCHFMHGTPVNVTHTVTINYPPTVDLQPRTVTSDVSMKNNVSFTCITEGQPEPVVSWYFTNEYGAELGMPVFRGQPTVNITHLDRADSGKYRCMADNGIGRPVFSPFARIVVTFPPEVADERKIFLAQIGRAASMGCVFHASPRGRFAVSWFRLNQTDGSEIEIPMDNRYRFESNIHGPKVQTLFWIYNVQETDLGNYTCWFKNEQGTAQRDVLLTTNVHVAHISAEDVPLYKLQKRILMVVESASPVKQYRIAFREVNQTSEGPSKEETVASRIEDLESTVGSAQTYVRSHVIENLRPGTSYSFKIAVQNARGWSPFSDTHSFHVDKITQ